jgi:hypothetical protein
MHIGPRIFKTWATLFSLFSLFGLVVYIGACTMVKLARGSEDSHFKVQVAESSLLGSSFRPNETRDAGASKVRKATPSSAAAG